jgi:hypothetical protein
MPDRSTSMSLISVLLLIRDDRKTKGAQRELLYALALRCQPDKAFICWPSYQQLALDTQLNEVTLKRAAHALEEAGYIHRVIRPNHSNKFFLNMAKIQAEAMVNRAADQEARAARKAVEVEEAPFPPPSPEKRDERPSPDAENQDDPDSEDSWDVRRGGR